MDLGRRSTLDLDALLQAHGESFNTDIGIDRQTILLAQCEDNFSRLFNVIYRANASWLMPQDNILSYSQGGNQHEVLMHHTNFQANSITRPGDVRELPVDVNLTAIGVNKTVENVHQRSFTCAVLAHQCMDLALADLEIDMIVSNDAGPGFSDVTHLHSKWYGNLFSCSHSRTFLHRRSPSLILFPVRRGYRRRRAV